MRVASTSGGVAPTVAPGTPSPTVLRLTRLTLLPLGLLLWAYGVSKTNTGHLGAFGLPAALPLTFYAGLAVVIASAGVELSRPRLSESRLALHAVSLVVILYGTAPLIYQEGRYAWLYKVIGVVRYVGARGSLDRSLDIYQNWPGFFALAAWFDKVSGAGSPLDYAKWAQLAFELAAIPLLYTIYQSLSLPVWHRWLAIMLYAGSNWIAQDYYSPQGIATLLSLGIMAIVARWMLTVVVLESDPAPPTSANYRFPRRRVRPTLFIALLLALFFVLTMTHELSPYIVAIQIGALTVARLVRPRWVALAIGVIALGYLAPNFAFVNSHYGLISSIGSFFRNLQPPSAQESTAVPESHHIISDCTLLLSAGVWCLALAGAWRRRKSGRIVLALLLLTFAPILVLLGGSYGNEGILRVYLFALPWAAALAAWALAPAHDHLANAGHNAFRAVVPLTLAVALFFPAFFGDDWSNVMPGSEVTTIAAFLDTARPGIVLSVVGNAPLSDNPDYDQFPTGTVYDAGGAISGDRQVPDIAAYLARTVEGYAPGQPAYIIMAPSMAAYDASYGGVPSAMITALLAALRASPYWTLAVNDDGTSIYELSAAAAKVPAGPSSVTLKLSVA